GPHAVEIPHPGRAPGRVEELAPPVPDGRVELRDGPAAAARLRQRGPELVRRVPHRRERPEAGDDDPPRVHLSIAAWSPGRSHELSLMYWIASLTVTIFSASSSGIWMSKCSSRAMTSCAVS